MALASISLRGFRNLEPTIVGFAEGSNYLFGPNGAGKTNLLEAIHYLATGRSFRRCPDSDLLGFGRDVLIVSGTDESGATAEIRFDGREKRILRNNIPVEKLSEYFGWLPVVVLLLEDIELVCGAPGIRRNFLDMALAKADRRTSTDYADGQRVEHQPKPEGRRQSAEGRMPEPDSHHQDTKTQRSGEEQAEERAKSEARSQRLEVRSEEGEGAEAEAGGQKLEARSEAGEQAKSEAKSQKPKAKSEEQSYITLMGEYRRAVHQYNRLLERSAVSGGRSAEELIAWEEEVVRAGVPVYEARLDKVGGLLENAAKHYQRLAGHGAVFSYRSSILPAGTRSEIVGGGSSQAKTEDSPPERSARGTVPVFASAEELAGAFRQRLATTRERARALRHALVGPHRDDLRITRGERELRKFGSVGEQRLAGIALRLAEADMILSAGRQRPVFLLDEVASELDEERSRMVLEMVAERGQMVYAAARRTVRPQVKSQSAKGKMQNGGQDETLAVRDSASALDHLTTGALEHFSGKEFHVEAGKVSEVS
ncbi:MAG: AAA family ATPase [candidate division WOR-3 bacterium]|nr:AAA family ATPase [candidate division WOR-3 bacterium]